MNFISIPKLSSLQELDLQLNTLPIFAVGQSTQEETDNDHMECNQEYKFQVLPPKTSKSQNKQDKIFEWFAKKGIKSGVPQTLKASYSQIQRSKIKRDGQCTMSKSGQLIRKRTGKDFQINL